MVSLTRIAGLAGRLGIALCMAAPAIAVEQQSPIGNWHCAIVTPGGDIRFQMQIAASSEDNDLRCDILNGPERISVNATLTAQGDLQLSFPHFDARIIASLQGDSLRGSYSKRRSKEKPAELEFSANRHPSDSESPDGFCPEGRWRVRFSSSSDPAVAVFSTTTTGTDWATILTTLGDYRYLSCHRIDDDSFEMSVFDGGHAFLFRGQLQVDGSIAGDFWSGGHWHETWTAVESSDAQLPDALQLTAARESVSLSELKVQTLQGDDITLADKRFQGKARVISLFGSWCPNCHDAAAFLSDLHDLYGADGLSIVGVAFELTGNFERDSNQVRRYIDRFDVRYPVVIGGLADKAAASKSFPLVDKVRAYPTMLFLDSSDRVTAVYTGFSGPATGAAHERLKDQIHEIVQGLLSTPEVESR